jgi:hypothetical protein
MYVNVIILEQISMINTQHLILHQKGCNIKNMII